MKKFNELGIIPSVKAFTGNKIEIDRILNTEITVIDSRVEDSKFKKDKGHNKCLYMQIQLSEIKYVVFTGSGSLIDQILQVPKKDFPFTTKIIKDNKQFQFT
jgi:hypothetical protein